MEDQSRSLVELLDSIEKYYEAKISVDLRKKDVFRAFSRFPEADKLDGALVLYWGSPELITVDDICSILQITKQEFLVVAKKNSPRIVVETCFDCKQEFKRTARSRSDLKGRKLMVCDSCKGERDVSRDHKVQEWREAQNKIIEELRSMSYQDYLKTEHWRSLRYQKLKRARFRCELCFRSNDLNVHHKTYARRGQEFLSDLTVLCRPCHQKFHDIYQESVSA